MSNKNFYASLGACILLSFSGCSINQPMQTPPAPQPAPTSFEDKLSRAALAKLITDVQNMKSEIDLIKIRIEPRLDHQIVSSENLNTLDSQKYLVVVSLANVNIRVCPSKTCNVKRVAKGGEIIEISGQDGDWLKTSDGFFIHKSTVKKGAKK